MNNFEDSTDTLSVIDAPWTEDTTYWNKTDDFNAKSIAADSDGNIYAAGSGVNLISETSNQDGWIRQFNRDGYEDTQNWNKYFSSVNEGSDFIYSVSLDSNDNIYICGINQANTAAANTFIKKFDRSGTEDTQYWNKIISGSYGNDIKLYIDQEDNIYFYGTLTNQISQNSAADIIIKKFDENGNEFTSWDKKLDGNNANDRIISLASIAETGAISIFAAGFGENIIADNSGKNWWLKKFDADGNEDIIQWNKKLDIRGECRQIIMSDNGPYFLGTVDNEINGIINTDLLIKKYTLEGSEFPEWNKTIDFLNSNNSGMGLLQANGNLVVIHNQEIASTHYWKMTEYNEFGYAVNNIWDTLFSGNGLQGNIIQGIRTNNSEIYLIGQIGIPALTYWIKKYIRR